MSQRLDLSPTTLLNSTQAHFLEQISDQEFWQHARKLAQMPFIPTIKTEEYLECELLPDRAIIPLTALLEVTPVALHLAQLPASPFWMLGITAWRGQAIAVIDLAAYFSQERIQSPRDQVLLIAHAAGITIGLTVTMRGTHTSIPADHIQAFNPATVAKANTLVEVIQGTYAGAFILNIPNLLTTLVQSLQVKSYE
jgi:chemotaxis signal transduction protein